jgi:hypothetical protein
MEGKETNFWWGLEKIFTSFMIDMSEFIALSIFTVLWTYVGVKCFRISVLHFTSLQPVVLQLSSAAKMEAAWIFQHIVMVIESVVMEVMKKIVVWIMNYY